MVRSARTPRLYSGALLVILLAVLTLGVTWMVYQFVYAAGLSDLRQAAIADLRLKERAVAAEIERYHYLPYVLAQDSRIQALLDRPETDPGAAKANAYLLNIATSAGADALFVLDQTGMTVAASNYLEPTSFLGQSYGFRPYFKTAIREGQGKYYAIGVTTGKPGYFLSHRIRTPSGRIGVAVVKVDMGPLERAWIKAEAASGIADFEGVIFLTGNERWKYRPLHPISSDTRRLIRSERRYDRVGIDGPPMTEVRPKGGEDEFQAVEGGQTLLVRTLQMTLSGWTLFTASDREPVNRQASLFATITCLAAALLSVLGFYIHQRRQLIQAKLLAHDELERRVEIRTRELAGEIEIRRRAEQELKRTQDSLIEAAKLAALGKMSAAIVHEVSQPLAALENVLAAANALAAKDRPEEVRSTLGTGRDLIRRMQRTVRHLKSFARKDQGTAMLVDIGGCLAAAREIVAHRLEREGVSLIWHSPMPAAMVRAKKERLEQVFINLFANALDALRGIAAPVMKVTVEQAQGQDVQVTISDNGAGVRPEIRGRITEPFFTTKASGEGLGLGLAISRMIVEDLGGSIAYQPAEEGGSAFTVSLPPAEAVTGLGSSQEAAA